MAARRGRLVWFAAVLLLSTSIGPAHAEPARVDSIKDLIARLRGCWQPPPASRAAGGIDITVVVSFNRDGHIFGHPKITYESEQATDNDRLAYRIAVMEALQRCTPMPFTEGMAGAVAGRPFAVRFHNRKTPPQPAGKTAWLIPKIP
jgi:hypothetical protein